MDRRTNKSMSEWMGARTDGWTGGVTEGKQAIDQPVTRGMHGRSQKSKIRKKAQKGKKLKNKDQKEEKKYSFDWIWVWCRSGEQATAGQQHKMQLIREEKLAANLKALLRRWVEGDQTGFRVRPSRHLPPVAVEAGVALTALRRSTAASCSLGQHRT